MEKYRVTSPVTFAAGTRLGLTEAQARPRRHALVEIKRGVYETVSSVQFKAGEEIGFDGDVPKGLLDSLGTDKPRKHIAKPAPAAGPVPPAGAGVVTPPSE